MEVGSKKAENGELNGACCQSAFQPWTFEKLSHFLLIWPQMSPSTRRDLLFPRPPTSQLFIFATKRLTSRWFQICHTAVWEAEALSWEHPLLTMISSFLPELSINPNDEKVQRIKEVSHRRCSVRGLLCNTLTSHQQAFAGCRIQSFQSSQLQIAGCRWKKTGRDLSQPREERRRKQRETKDECVNQNGPNQTQVSCLVLSGAGFRISWSGVVMVNGVVWVLLLIHISVYFHFCVALICLCRFGRKVFH